MKKFNLKHIIPKISKVREITPLIEDLSKFGQSIRKDIKDIHDTDSKISEQHKKLDDRFTAIKARIDSVINKSQTKCNHEAIEGRKQSKSSG